MRAAMILISLLSVLLEKMSVCTSIDKMNQLPSENAPRDDLALLLIRDENGEMIDNARVWLEVRRESPSVPIRGAVDMVDLGHSVKGVVSWPDGLNSLSTRGGGGKVWLYVSAAEYGIASFEVDIRQLWGKTFVIRDQRVRLKFEEGPSVVPGDEWSIHFTVGSGLPTDVDISWRAFLSRGKDVVSPSGIPSLGSLVLENSGCRVVIWGGRLQAIFEHGRIELPNVERLKIVGSENIVSLKLTAGVSDIGAGPWESKCAKGAQSIIVDSDWKDRSLVADVESADRVVSVALQTIGSTSVIHIQPLPSERKALKITNFVSGWWDEFVQVRVSLWGVDDDGFRWFSHCDVDMPPSMQGEVSIPSEVDVVLTLAEDAMKKELPTGWTFPLFPCVVKIQSVGRTDSRIKLDWREVAPFQVGEREKRIAVDAQTIEALRDRLLLICGADDLGECRWICRVDAMGLGEIRGIVRVDSVTALDRSGVGVDVQGTLEDGVMRIETR